jgi:hypothetical protein
MMTPLLLMIPLAASAAAQLTTSIWIPAEVYGTDKLGFYGSVIAADEGHTTLLLNYDNGTQTEALELPSEPQTVTVGPTMWEVVATPITPYTSATSDVRSDDYDYRLRCEKQTAEDARPTCTKSWGRSVASKVYCGIPVIPPRSTSTVLQSFTHSYGSRGSYPAGVETVVKTVTWKPRTTPRPDWCDTETLASTFSGFTEIMPDSMVNSEVMTYQVVMTAGLEKLPTGKPTASSAAAAPLKTAGSVVGYGAAMAVFFL